MPLKRDTVDATLATPYGEAAYKIVEELTGAGFDTWWVGGAVRDMLGKHIPTDIDIGTAATPDQIQHIFEKTDMTSAALGSVRVTQKKYSFEVTSFREDDEASDGRHPESVAFGTLEQDAKRRDFTINALYFHPITRELFDPFDGEADLKERLIRFIGDPAIRIKHDALRILRAVRFRARIAGQYHPETYRALQEHAQTTQILSGVRILEEFQKFLLSPNSDRALEDWWELRISEYLLPELHACKGIPQPSDYHHEGDVWEHTLACMRAFHPEHGIDVRIAAVFHDAGKAQTFSLKERIRFDHHASVSAEITKKVLTRMQMPAKRREKICWIIEHHMMMGSFAEMDETRKAHWYFHPWFPELLQVMWLDIAGTDPAEFSLYDSIIRDFNAFVDAHPRPVKPLLSGAEVMEIMGIGPGEKVGEALAALHAAQTKGEITTKNEAREFMQKYAKNAA